MKKVELVQSIAIGLKIKFIKHADYITFIEKILNVESSVLYSHSFKRFEKSYTEVYLVTNLTTAEIIKQTLKVNGNYKRKSK